MKEEKYQTWMTDIALIINHSRFEDLKELRTKYVNESKAPRKELSKIS